MLLPDNDRARPATTPDGPTKSIATDETMVPAERPQTPRYGHECSPDHRHLVVDDPRANELAGVYVVRVVIDDAGHQRSNYYRNLAAAERAVDRARERGRAATVVLCKLMPVGVIEAGGRW